MMADRPGREEAGNPDEELITVIRVPEHVSDRTHFQLGSGEMGTTPAGRPKFDPRRCTDRKGERNQNAPAGRR